MMPWDFEQPETVPHPVEAPAGEMLRLNTGKPRLSFLPTSFVLIIRPLRKVKLMEDTARVMEFGASKYAKDNWRKSGPWMKVLDSGLRHLDKMMYTLEINDPESGINHAGHLGCNLSFLTEFIREGDGQDDRYAHRQGNQNARR